MHILQGRIITPFQEFAGRVGIENGITAAVGEDLPTGSGDRVEDFGDNYICPGFLTCMFTAGNPSVQRNARYHHREPGCRLRLCSMKMSLWK